METIVIIAIVVLVMVVLIAFFVTGSGRQINTINAQEALARGCTDFVVRVGCQNEERMSEISIIGYQGGLEKACRDNGYADNAVCAQLGCKCP